jgi:hypothetical protein
VLQGRQTDRHQKAGGSCQEPVNFRKKSH